MPVSFQTGGVAFGQKKLGQKVAQFCPTPKIGT